MSVNENIKDFILSGLNDNSALANVIEAIEIGAISPNEVFNSLK